MSDWQPLGDRAIRFEKPPAASPRRLVEIIRAWPGVVDVVVSREHVGVYFDGPPHVDSTAMAELTDPKSRRDEPAAGRNVDLHVAYDGVDLADVAREAMMTIEEVITTHAERTYVVESMGFVPGFAYLTGLDPRLASIARRATPRAKVPALSLALAGGYCGVYPFESPGGWHLIGHVSEPMFGEDGALLQLGDRVRFVR